MNNQNKDPEYTRLDKLVDKIQPEYVSDIPIVKGLIKEFCIEIIGENEPISNKLTGASKSNYNLIMARNKLRRQLRQKVEEL